MKLNKGALIAGVFYIGYAALLIAFASTAREPYFLVQMSILPALVFLGNTGLANTFGPDSWMNTGLFTLPLSFLIACCIGWAISTIARRLRLDGFAVKLCCTYLAVVFVMAAFTFYSEPLVVFPGPWLLRYSGLGYFLPQGHGLWPEILATIIIPAAVNLVILYFVGRAVGRMLRSRGDAVRAGSDET